MTAWNPCLAVYTHSGAIEGRTNWAGFSWSIPARVQAVGFGITQQSLAGCQYGHKHSNVWVLGGATKQTTGHCVQTAGNALHLCNSTVIFLDQRKMPFRPKEWKRTVCSQEKSDTKEETAKWFCGFYNDSWYCSNQTKSAEEYVFVDLCSSIAADVLEAVISVIYCVHITNTQWGYIHSCKTFGGVLI